MLKRLWKPCLLAGSAGVAWASHTQDLRLQLDTPLASYSPAGAAFEARVTGRFEGAGRAAILPRGTTVRGTVREAHAIGLGVRRERAELTLEFAPSCRLPDGESVACEVRLLAVDNARETVNRNSKIRGTLAASHPPRILSGMWYRPNPGLFMRPVSGLAGAGGMLSSRLAPGPVGAALFITTRLLFFRIPDPDIELPAGTGLIARISTEDAGPDGGGAVERIETLPEGFGGWLAAAPAKTTRADGAAVADQINLAFFASQPELEAAFEAAGWHGTDALTTRTFARTYSAFVKMRAYERAPVSTLHYEGRPPDLVFQKAFNTVARRHHIRLWKQTLPGGETAWLGAATHDVGIAFDWNRMNLTHRIDPRIDRERGKVMSDLQAVECLDGVTPVVREQPEKGEAITDGAVWAATLKACRAESGAPLTLTRPQHSRLKLSVRRMMLESRYYLLRANPYHFTYDSIRQLAQSRRSRTTSDSP